MSETIGDIINDALGALLVIQVGQPAPPEHSDLGLRLVNRLVSSWSAEGVQILGLQTGTCALTGAASYTIGLTGNIVDSLSAPVVRPAKIISLAVIAANGTYKPVDPISRDLWDEILDKTRTGLFSEHYYCDYGYPLATIYLSPKPSAGTLSATFWKAIPEFTGLTDAAEFPSGVARALMASLAIELEPFFPRQVDPVLVNIAAQAKMTIQRLNADVLRMAPMPQTTVPQAALPGQP